MEPVWIIVAAAAGLAIGWLAGRQGAQSARARQAELGAELEQLRKERDALIVEQARLAERSRNLEAQKAEVETVFKAASADILKEAVAQLQTQAKGQSESSHKLIDETLKPLKEQLKRSEELVARISQKQEGDAKTLGEQLRQIAELQQKASSAAQTLSSALRDNRQRGQWGEISLRNIAELAGLSQHVDFTEQASVEGDAGNRLRPDMIVRLPGNRFLPIDSKVPMSAYLDSLNHALSDAERLTRRAEHAKALRNHVRALAGRDYAKALGTSVEITVLFVPLESGLIAALEEDPELYNEALQKRIVITTASTLLALMRVCALQWQQAAINENAREIQVAGQELYGRLVTFAEHMEKVRKGLNGAVESFNKASASMESRLLPKARDLKRLGAATQDEIGAAAPIEISAQPLSIENHAQENEKNRQS